MQRAVGQLIDLIADRDREHLVGGVRCHARGEQERHRADAKERRRRVDRQALDRGTPIESAFAQRLLPCPLSCLISCLLSYLVSWAGLKDEFPRLVTCDAHTIVTCDAS